jgi:hypothetical protein
VREGERRTNRERKTERESDTVEKRGRHIKSLKKETDGKREEEREGGWERGREEKLGKEKEREREREINRRKKHKREREKKQKGEK